jgi:hypothetical protein
MGKDYYGILGVAKGADEAELKKGAPQPGPLRMHAVMPSAVCCAALLSAPHSQRSSTHPVLLLLFACVLAAYRKLAMKWHPVSQ